VVTIFARSHQTSEGRHFGRISSRGYLPEQIEQWTPSPDELTVPQAFYEPIDEQTYRRFARYKELSFNAYLCYLFPLTFLSFIFMLSDDTNLNLFIWTTVVLTFFLIVTPLSSFYCRHRAMRILLLRPFGDSEMTIPLRQFVLENLGWLGYVFTLSDGGYRQDAVLSATRFYNWFWYVIIYLILNPLFRNSFRVAIVRSERGFAKLHRFLACSFYPSLISFLSGGQAFNIVSANKWWKTCILTLMYSCDLIIVDLSVTKSGTNWELRQIISRKFVSKCIFVASETYEFEVSQMLKTHFNFAERPRVNYYKSDGEVIPSEAEAFQDQLNKLTKATFVAWADIAGST
jgi:hypothetical protein